MNDIVCFGVLSVIVEASWSIPRPRSLQQRKP